MTLERHLIEQCAPTLARLKTGSLFTADCGTHEQLMKEIAACEQILTPKDVHIAVMREQDGRALLYVYRGKRLAQDLSCPLRREFLTECGYARFDVASAVDTLRQRICQQGAFPHEIGLFLGYPLKDVEGFVANCGRNCLMCGPWKVYHDVQGATRQFERMRKCTQVYRRLYEQGIGLIRLTVPTSRG